MRVGKMVRTFLLAVVALSAPRLLGECRTNEPSLVDLTTWTNVQYGPFGQPPANWVLQGSNTVLQTVNADASIFISPFTVAADQIRGSWRVDTSDDNDYIGFAFGFQDTQHFYLFDWKQDTQVHPSGAVGQRGIAVKAIHANSTLMAGDIYATFPANTNRARNLYYNPNVSWVDFTEYQFNLQFFPGQFTITVSQGATVLDQFTINDNTYTSGRFGFYNFSQGMVLYSGFARQVLEQRPAATVPDSSVVEGHSGTTQLVFNVTLSETNCDITSFDYVIVPGSATTDVDYTVSPVSGTLVFLPGETNKQVTVTVIGDILSEANETFLLRLTNTVRGLIVDPQAVGTILDDDFGPALQIDNVSVVEGNAGTVTAVFQVTLASQSDQNVQVQYFTRNGTAQAGSDYAARPLTTLIIPAGQNSATIPVTVLGDISFEPDETFFVCLTNAIGVTLSTACATGTIQNDDGNTPPTVAIVAPTEGAFFYTPPGIVAIEAEAFDVDDAISHVEFYADGLLLDLILQPPYVTRWTNTLSGRYVLTAVATDAFGTVSTSAPVHIVIGTCDAPESQFALEISSTRGGIVVPDPFCEKYPPGTVVELRAIPATGWRFLNWVGDVSGTNGLTTVVMRSDICVYAAFGTPLTATTDGDGTIIIDPPSQFYPYGQTVRLTAVPKAGSYFVRWIGDAVGTNNPLALVIDNGTPTITALFAPVPDNQHAYTVVPIGKGRVTRPRANAFDAHVMVTNTPLPEPAQQFLQWSGDTNGAVITSSNLIVRSETNRTIYAHFTRRSRLDLLTCGQRGLNEGFRIRIIGEFGASYLLENTSSMDVWAANGIVNTPFGLGDLEQQDGGSQKYYRAREEGLAGLVAYYPFAGNATDLTLRGNHGTVNGALLTTDRFGARDTAYEFNGVDSFIAIPDSDVFQFRSYTISFWFNPATLPDTSDLQHEAAMLFSKGRNHFEIHLGTPPYTNAGIRFLPALLNATRGQLFDAPDVAIETNRWHHLVAVYDGNSTNAHVYLNGRELSLIHVTGPDQDDNARFPARIGMRYDAMGPNTGLPFKGKLDELRIFNRVLNAAEAQTLFILQE